MSRAASKNPASRQNGKGGPTRFVKANAPGVDPMARILGIERRLSTASIIALLVATALHGTAAARTAMIPVDLLRWSRSVQASIGARLTAEYEVEVEKDDASPEPEPEEETPPPQTDNTPPSDDNPYDGPDENPYEGDDQPPPDAAQAGAVLTSEPDPDAPLDFTDTFVTGTGDAYAGGTTQRGGTSKTAVRSRQARRGGRTGGTGKGPSKPGPQSGADRSKPAGLKGSSDWRWCRPWPDEADAEGIDDAVVTIRVFVGANGKPTSAVVLQDPGYGFGKLAKRCAMQQSYTPPLDRGGSPISGKTRPIRIRFER